MKRTRYLFPILGVLAVWLLASGCDSGASGLGADGDEPACPCEAGCDDEGNCLVSCNSGADCPPGQICDDGTCRESGKPSDGDDSDNPDGDLPTDGDEVRDPDKPWIQVDPLYLDFGAVALGQRAERTIRVSNRGGENLVISGAYLKESDPELALLNLSLPLVIAPQDDALLTAEFAPQDLEEDLDWLVIESNDPLEPSVEVQIVTGVKAYGQLTVSPEAVDFGLVRMGDHTQTVTITNGGGLDVQLVGLAIEEGSAEFSIPGAPTGVSDLAPFTVGPRGSLVVTVHYIPQAPDGLPDAGTLVVLSRDETAPRIVVPLSGSCCEPEIEALPTALDFSTVHAGQTAVRCLTVRNLGCMDLTLESLNITEDASGGFTWESRVDDGTVLSETDEIELCIHFAPTAPDQGNGMLEIRSDDADEAVLQIPLASDVVFPDIECTPSRLDFGNVFFGETPSLIVTCRNTSTAALHISGATITSATTPYTVTGTPEGVLLFEDELEIEVTYAPTAVGTHRATLAIASDDPDENPVNIALTGKGVDPNRCPVAEIEILSPIPPDIYLNDTVNLNGGVSHDPDDGDSISTYTWTLLSRPAGSAAQIQGQGSAQIWVYMDKAGLYRVQLHVRDSEGVQSCEAAVIEFESRSRPPEISCTPLYIDYGEVAVGFNTTRYVTCQNLGYEPLQISNYQVVTPAPGVFALDGNPSATLQYSESVFIGLRYTPATVGDDEGALRIHSNDPAQPLVTVTLVGGNFIPNTCPVAAAAISSPTGPIEQFNTVQLDGRGSYDPDPGDAVSQYVWTLEQRPASSVTTIHPFGVAQPSLYIDQPGFYRIRLDVKDSTLEQMISCAPAYLEFTAEVPPPVIVCSPLVVNYGVVPIGTNKTETIQCRNEGSGFLRLSSVTVQTPQAGLFVLANVPTMDLPPGSFTNLDVRYSPASVASHTGSVRVLSNDPVRPQVDISLMANSYDPNTCPVARIQVTSPDLSRLKPLDTVQFDGRSSSDPDAGDRIVEYIWTIESRPSGSTSQLQNASGGTPSFFVDLAGHYWIKLQVRDSRGMLSCQPAYQELYAIPRQIIHVELTWNTSEGDMDLHLVRPGGSLWSSSGDCYFSYKNPNWSQYGRPSLDIDDQHGYGPENINLNNPGAGTYKVYVHYWDAWSESRTVGVTVRIYIWGNLAKTYTINWPRADEHKRWFVADIVWNGTDAVVNNGSTSLEADGHGN